MAIQDIINDSWNGSPNKDVREGIQAALREITRSLANKANLASFGGAKKIPYDQLPLAALANTTPITTLNPGADVVSANKLWYYSDGTEHTLYYRGSDENDTKVGSPSYILYYSYDKDGKQYKVYRWKGNGFEAISEIDSTLLEGKASLDSKTGKLPYGALPGMVLVTMGSTLDGKDVNLLNVRDRSLYDPVTRTIRYINGTGGFVPCGSPDPDILYCNEASGKLYRWDEYGGSDHNGDFVPITSGSGEPVDLTGYLKSSDIVNDATQGGADKVLSAEVGKQMTGQGHVVVEKISATELSLPTGRSDYWYILYNEGGDADNLVVHLSAAGAVAHAESYPMSSGKVYYSIEKDAFYRYNTTTRRLTRVDDVEDAVTEDSKKAVTSGAVFSALAALQAQIDTLGDSEGLSTILGQIESIQSTLADLTDEEGIVASITALQAAVADLYTKPGTGIPKTDLAEAVQTSLGKADSAVQQSDLSGYALKNEMSFTDGTGANADKTIIQLKSGTTKQVLTAHQDISEKANLIGGVLDPAEWPRTSIINVGEIPRSTAFEVGDVLFNPSNSKLLLIVGPAAGQGNDIMGYAYMTLGDPGKNILYHCKRDGKFYLWSGTEFIQAAEIGGKADLTYNGNVDMLKMDQWPRTVIKSVTPGLSDTEGEVYFDTGLRPSDPIGLFIMHDNVRYFIGAPSEHVVYLAKDTGRFYRWDNNNYEFVEVGTHAEFDVADLPTEGSTNPISSGAVYTALKGKANNVGGHLAYTDAPVMVLDKINVVINGLSVKPADLSLGQAKYYTDGKIRRLYYSTAGSGEGAVVVVDSQTPSPYMLYWDKDTQRMYRWESGQGMIPLTVAGGVPGGAAIDEVTGKIDYSQLPTMVLDGIELSYASPLSGEVGKTYHCTDGKIRYIFADDSGDETIYYAHEMTPSEGVVYTVKDTGHQYRWQAGSGNNVGQMIPVGVVNIIQVSGSGAKEQVVLPDTYYKFTGSLTSLRLNLTAVPDGTLGVYFGKFTAGSNGCSVEVLLPGALSSNSTLTASAGDTCEYYIVDGVLSLTIVGSTNANATTGINLVALSIGSGSLLEADSRAALNPNTTFQWLLLDTDNNNNQVRKMIWHVGNREFIDALGATYRYNEDE